MSIVTIIFTAITAFDGVWLIWADRQLRSVTTGITRLVSRAGVWAFGIGQALYLFFAIVDPQAARGRFAVVPVWAVAAVYLWGILVMPLTLLLILGYSIGRPVLKAAVKVDLSRRLWLRRSLVAAGPVVTAVAVGKAVGQLGGFRVRRESLAVSGLPAALDGLRITQVSDLHLGRWTMPGSLQRLVSAVNGLDHDLLVFTGDLIDFSLTDLRAGIGFLRALQPRWGVAIIEGNHDLIQDPDAFDETMKAAGLPLLVDQATTFKVRGQGVQFLGMRWGNADGDRRKTSTAGWTQSLHQTLLRLRDPAAFPILLAHHPHVFDLAAAAGLPLTLSGHTHGGQLNLTPEVGMGPVFYRYWSGTYRKAGSTLFVNNGVGNWFPLRVNAPAEIVELTLRPAR
jgi:predicted MPP superfamily phosphohydrolase